MTCDVFVIFGITGDLAKVMTFRSLYRLEARKLLDCPIIGVAVDDWTHDQLVDRARQSIVATGEQLGNFPQAFSHLSLINAAVNLDYQLDHGSGYVDPVLHTGRRGR